MSHLINADVTVDDAADEAALIAAIKTAWDARGGNSAVTGNVTWFWSDGEDGYSRIVFGLDTASATGNRILALAGADIALSSIESIGGLTDFTGYNYDGDSGLPSGQQAILRTSTSAATIEWGERDGGSSYRYRLAVSLDGIACVVTYLSGAATAQAVILCGKVIPLGKAYLRQAKSRIHSITPSTPSGTRTQITLEDDITALLKDPADANESTNQTPRLFFQTIWNSGGVVGADLAKVESTTYANLTTVGGRTQFDVPNNLTLNTTKLFGSTASTDDRYHSGRGVGDLVRILPEPTVVICGGGPAPYTRFNGTSENALATWDRYGGQQAEVTGAQRLIVTIHNGFADQNADGFDFPNIGGDAHYYMYIALEQFEDRILGQAQGDAEGTVGYMPNVILYPDQAQGDLNVFTIDCDTNQRYLGTFALINVSQDITNSDKLVYAVGPGA